MRSRTSVNLGIGCTGFSFVLTCLLVQSPDTTFRHDRMNLYSLEDTSPWLFVDLACTSRSPAQLGIMEQDQNAIGSNMDI